MDEFCLVVELAREGMLPMRLPFLVNRPGEAGAFLQTAL